MSIQVTVRAAASPDNRPWGSFDLEYSEFLERSVGSALELALTGLEGSDRSCVIVCAFVFSSLLRSLGFLAPAAPACDVPVSQGRDDGPAAGDADKKFLPYVVPVYVRSPEIFFFGFVTHATALARFPRLPGRPAPGLLNFYTTVTLGSALSYGYRSAQASVRRYFGGNAPAVYLTPGAHYFYVFAPFPSLGLIFGRIHYPVELLPRLSRDTRIAGMQMMLRTGTIGGIHKSTLMPYSSCGFFYRSLYFVLHLSLLWFQRKAFIALFYQ